jgi:hypothetical protein
MRARKGGSSQSRLAAMTMREREKRPTVRAVTTPDKAARLTTYCIHFMPAPGTSRVVWESLGKC